MKKEYYCRECGGTNVLTQNFLEWDKEKQEWKVADDHPDIDGYSHPIIRGIEWCMDCEEIREMGKREIKFKFDLEYETELENVRFMKSREEDMFSGHFDW